MTQDTTPSTGLRRGHGRRRTFAFSSRGEAILVLGQVACALGLVVSAVQTALAIFDLRWYFVLLGGPFLVVVFLAALVALERVRAVAPPEPSGGGDGESA